MTKSRIVACPTCRKSIEYSAKNAHRPFCSERCRTMDAAAWADDQYRLAGESTNECDPADEVES